MSRLLTVECDKCEKEIMSTLVSGQLDPATWHIVHDPFTKREYDFCSIACLTVWSSMANEIHEKVFIKVVKDETSS